MEPNANDKARKVAEEALNRLSAELEAGRSEGLKSYLSAMSRIRRYSWGNVLLIASQRPARPMWPVITCGTRWAARSKRARKAS